MIAIFKRYHELERENLRLQSRVGSLLATVRATQKQNDKLTQAIIEMKREGFQAPTSQPELQRRPDPFPAEVEDMIERLSGDNAVLYASLARDARRFLANDMTPADVVRRLEAGGDEEIE